MTAFNIYIAGVGGQGIGLLSDIICQTLIQSGLLVLACDTHGVAQRGGQVVSQIRIGHGAHTPHISPGQANLVLGLERLEAYRAAHTMLKSRGTLIYYDTVFQPLSTRRDNHPYPSGDTLEKQIHQHGGICHRVFQKNIQNPKLQNMALLGALAGLQILPEIQPKAVRRLIKQMVPKSLISPNLAVFDTAVKIFSSTNT